VAFQNRSIVSKAAGRVRFESIGKCGVEGSLRTFAGDLPRALDGHDRLAEEVSDVGPARGDPVVHLRFGERGKFGESLEAPPGIGELLRFHLQPEELREDEAAFQTVARFGQQRDGRRLAAASDEEVRHRLHRGAVPRVQRMGLLGGGEGLVQLVLDFQDAGALDVVPRTIRGRRFGLGEVEIGEIEIAEAGADEGQEGLPVAADFRRRFAPVRMLLGELPAAERAEAVEAVAGEVVGRFGISRAFAVGQGVELAAEPGRAELHGQPPRDQPPGRPGPAAKWAVAQAVLVRRAVLPIQVQFPDACDVGGRELHRRHVRRSRRHGGSFGLGSITADILRGVLRREAGQVSNLAHRLAELRKAGGEAIEEVGQAEVARQGVVAIQQVFSRIAGERQVGPLDLREHFPARFDQAGKVARMAVEEGLPLRLFVRLVACRLCDGEMFPLQFDQLAEEIGSFGLRR